MPEFHLMTKALLAASFAVSKDQTRYYLGGVYVEPAPHPETGKGARFIATDGYIMIVAFDPLSTATHSAILSMPWTDKALKPARKDIMDRYLKVSVERGKTAIGQIVFGDDAGDDQDPTGTLMVNSIDGTFPDWTMVLPPFENGTPGLVFDPTMVDRVSRGFAVMASRPDPVMAIGQKKANEPMIVTHPDCDAIFAVVMPKRGEARSRPDWLNLHPSQQEQAA